jgi:hypothetical protein
MAALDILAQRHRVRQRHEQRTRLDDLTASEPPAGPPLAHPLS